MAVKNISGQGANPTPTAGRVSESTTVNAPRSTKIADTNIVGAKSGTAGGLPKGVDVAVSNDARSRVAEQKRVKELAMNAPEVREDRVAALKSQIDAGTYKVDSDKIANGMMREAVMEHLTSDQGR